MRSMAVQFLGGFGRIWRSLLAVGPVWLGQTSICLAQLPGQEAQKPKTYAPIYIIIVFTVGLALLLICRTAKRDDKIRRP